MNESYLPNQSKETELSGKNIVVIGASSGLGYSLSELLSKEGSSLFLLSRTIEDKELGFDSHKINCNVSDPKSVIKAFEAIDRRTDRIDTLVNCAGIGLTKKLEQTTQDEIGTVINTNLTGAIDVSLEAYKRMVPNKSGHIINVSSTTGLVARDSETIYAASKWGLRGFTESLRLEAAQHKIRVTGVYPGGMRSNFWKEEPDKDLSKYMDPLLVAGQIVNLLKSDPSLSPSELVIQRGF